VYKTIRELKSDLTQKFRPNRKKSGSLGGEGSLRPSGEKPSLSEKAGDGFGGCSHRPGRVFS